MELAIVIATTLLSKWNWNWFYFTSCLKNTNTANMSGQYFFIANFCYQKTTHWHGLSVSYNISMNPKYFIESILYYYRWPWYNFSFLSILKKVKAFSSIFSTQYLCFTRLLLFCIVQQQLHFFLFFCVIQKTQTNENMPCS